MNDTEKMTVEDFRGCIKMLFHSGTPQKKRRNV